MRRHNRTFTQIISIWKRSTLVNRLLSLQNKKGTSNRYLSQAILVLNSRKVFSQLKMKLMNGILKASKLFRLRMIGKKRLISTNEQLCTIRITGLLFTIFRAAMKKMGDSRLLKSGLIDYIKSSLTINHYILGSINVTGNLLNTKKRRL
jgi:hypothetical protein